MQGVFFRAFTIEKANRYNLTGWVQNTTDDKVKGEAQGEEDDLKKLLKDVNDGPRAAHVVRVDKEGEQAVPFPVTGQVFSN